MRSMDSRDVEQAVAEMVRVLTPYEFMSLGRPGRVAGMELLDDGGACRHDLLAYAGQVRVSPGAPLTCRSTSSSTPTPRRVTCSRWSLPAEGY